LAAGEQQAAEAAADRGQDDVVHVAAEFPLDRLDIVEGRTGAGIPALRADRAASRRADGSGDTGEESAAAARPSGSGSGTGDVSKIIQYRPVPEIPSTMQWCTLEISAQ